MSVLNFKPHRLSFLVVEGGYEDENGDYHPGTSQWVGNEECDAVPNGKAEERTFEDGTVSGYTYTVFLKPNCREFSKGERVKIKLYGGIEREFEVKGFHRYQHQAKIWV